MTSESWLTYEEIAAAADDLWRRKKAVSAQTVYEALGARGSKATIQKHVNHWRLILDDLPTPPDPVLQAVKQVWEGLEIAAKTQLATQQEIQQIALQAAQKLQQAAEQESALNREALQITQKESTALLEQVKILQADWAQEVSARRVAEERAQAAEQRFVDQERVTRQQIQSLQEEQNKVLVLLKEQIANHQKTINDTKEQQEQQRHKYMVELDSLKVANQKWEQRYEKLVLAEQQLKDQSQLLKEEQQSLISKLKESAEEKGLLGGTVQEKTQQVAVLQKECEQVNKQMSYYQQQWQDTLQKLMQAQQHAVLMEERLYQAQLELKQAQKINNQEEGEESNVRIG